MHRLPIPNAFLTADVCRTLFDRIVQMGTGGGHTFVTIISAWSGSARWMRNRLHTAADICTTDVLITRNIRGASGVAQTGCMTDAAVRQAVRDAEASLQVSRETAEQIQDPSEQEPTLQPVLWSEKTYDFGAEQRTQVAESMMRGADAAGLMTTGDLTMLATGTATMSTEGLFRYYPQTDVECSMTVRHPKGKGSGWAGVNHHDIGRIDPSAIATRALAKARMSANPVAMEPGRYPVILEPQATADLFAPLIEMAMDRVTAELPRGPFGRSAGRSRITERVFDERLMLHADPMDVDGAFLPYDQFTGTPYRPVRWIDHGVLKELAYHKRYALSALGLNRALPNPRSYRLGPAPGVRTATVDEMIEVTERGILVTRFFNVELLDFESMLCTGVTRDGVWLIEHGKIVKPIKNLRFVESPMFVLNKIDDVGCAERVFAPSFARLAPAAKVHDFAFTSLTDAI
jgi:predicted Zn-dependent protease